VKVQRWLAVGLVAATLAACGTPREQATNSTPAASPAPTVAPTADPSQPFTTGDPVARYENASLSRQLLDERVGRLETGMKKQPNQGQQMPSALDIEKELVERFIQQQLTIALAKQKSISISDASIDEQITQFKAQIEGSGGKIEEAVQDQLGFAGADSPDFREFVTFFIARQKLAETLVTTDTVRTRVTEEVMAEAKKEVEKADVAHILVKTEDEAKKVIERLDKGEEFGALAKELSEDPGSKDNGGEYKGIAKGQFVPEFEKAMFEDLKPGETTKTPVKSEFGFHVIRLLARVTGPAMSEEDAKAQIEQAVPAELQRERGEALSKLIEDERAKAKADGRLVEPTYPEPTPVPLTIPPTDPNAPAAPPTDPNAPAAPAPQPTNAP
jgi:peptidyl-prolyl cis-trans isomerase C